MRTSSILLPLLFCAAPAFAEGAPPPPPPIALPEMQRALNDPAMADRLANVMQAMSKAFLDLPVGQVQAALEGRQPTPVERRRTVRDLGRRDDPNFERNFQRQIANAKPMIRASQKALSEAIPAMMQGLEQASEAIERATANLPDPTYPRR